MANKTFLRKKDKSGFTLIETLVAIGSGVIITAMIIFVFTTGLKHIRLIKNSEILNSNATFILDKITYLIKHGEDFRVLPASPGDTLEITFPNNSTTSINKSDFETDDINVTTTFKKFQRSVQINFIIQVKNTTSTFSATTTIAQRAL